MAPSAETRFSFIECAPDGILLADRDGRIVHANPRATKLFGYTREELIGRSHYDLVPERFRPTYANSRAHYGIDSTVWSTGLGNPYGVGLRKDGTEFPAEVSFAPPEGPDGLSIAFVRDVTDLRRLQRDQVRAAERVSRLNAVASALSAAFDVEEVTRVTTSMAFELAGTRTGTLARPVENGLAIEIVGEEVANGRERIPIDARVPVCDVARSRSALWLQGSSELEARYPALGPSFTSKGVRSLVCLPLISRGELVGVLSLPFTNERTFDSEERSLLASLGQQCATAMDRAQLYEEAIAARDQAERASVVRDELLAIVAHDLGNPMSAIALRARYLFETAPAGAEGELVRSTAAKIQETVSGMALLLADLGDVASIDAGHLRLKMQEPDAETMVRDTVDAFAPLCAEKGLSILGQAPAVRVACDPHRALQALGNLVANAIKLTPSGGAITVAAVRSGTDVRFSVTDTGPGIPNAMEEHIFERYWPGKTRDLTNGVGLGLYVAKSIVLAHGGKIWVDSVAGHGCTFSFTLPAKEDSR